MKLLRAFIGDKSSKSCIYFSSPEDGPCETEQRDEKNVRFTERVERGVILSPHPQMSNIFQLLVLRGLIPESRETYQLLCTFWLSQYLTG